MNSGSIKVSSLSPANMLYYLGLISFEGGLFEKSEEYYLKGIELDPDFADLHFQLGLCTKEKMEVCRRVLSRDSST